MSREGCHWTGSPSGRCLESSASSQRNGVTPLLEHGSSRLPEHDRAIEAEPAILAAKVLADGTVSIESGHQQRRGPEVDGVGQLDHFRGPTFQHRIDEALRDCDPILFDTAAERQRGAIPNVARCSREVSPLYVWRGETGRRWPRC
jgi:hypothetical protein